MPLYPPISDPSFAFASVSGPASYPTGGFEIDLSNLFSDVEYLSIAVESGGALPDGRLEVIRNSPSAGRVKVRVMRARYDKTTGASGAPGALPSGVTVAAASGNTAQTVDALGTGNAQRVNQLYTHTHTPGATTATLLALDELPAATDISTTTFRYLAIGQ